MLSKQGTRLCAAGRGARRVTGGAPSLDHKLSMPSISRGAARATRSSRYMLHMQHMHRGAPRAAGVAAGVAQGIMAAPGAQAGGLGGLHSAVAGLASLAGAAGTPAQLHAGDLDPSACWCAPSGPSQWRSCWWGGYRFILG
jgi:hypothetical protein